MPSVYGICDPDTGVIRYVGKSVDPPMRFRQHIRNAFCSDSRTHLANWIRSLDRAPELTILEYDPSDANSAERAWIDRLDGLCNHTPGGDGTAGYRWTDEQRARHRKRMAQVNASSDKREASRLGGMKGGSAPCSAATREKIAESLTGCKRGAPSAETRAKISAARKGKFNHKKNCACGFCTGRAGNNARWRRDAGVAPKAGDA